MSEIPDGKDAAKVQEFVADIEKFRQSEQWKRDRFFLTGAALQGMLANPETYGAPADMAKLAVDYADKCLAALSAATPQGEQDG